MRAFAIDQFGQFGSVQDLPQPKPGQGEVLIRVNVAGVNPADWKNRDGNNGPRPFPLILGIDYAGVVVGAGSDVVDFAVGDRVFGAARKHGAFAEFTVAPVDDSEQPIALIPASISDEQAAALPVAGLTALAALARLDVHEGDSMLVIGATGAVGSIILQIARQRGIHTIATARSGKEALARALGADDVIVYDQENIVDAVLAKQPNGVSAVFDLVSNKDALKPFVALLRTGGRIASAVFGVDEPWFAERDILASNIAMYRTPQSSRAGLQELVMLIETGALIVHFTAKRTLDDAGDVLSALKAGHLSGKIVLNIVPDVQHTTKDQYESR